MDGITFGILTVSDTCFEKLAKDTSGPLLEQHIISDFPNSTIILKAIVPDSQPAIKDKLIEWSQPKMKCNVIFTTGGTGFAIRDVTPEATRSVIEKEASGLATAMVVKSLEKTELGMLSRGVCGIRCKTLIVNLPGSPKAVAECFGFVKKAIPHAVALLTDAKDSVAKAHLEAMSARRSVSLEVTRSRVLMDRPSVRSRTSPFPMVELDDALQMIYANCPESDEVETVTLDHILYRILAEDIFADDPLPPFPASIKDGYAIKASDGVGIRVVRGAVAAGDGIPSEPLKAGEAIRINTGAAVPAGADAVVQVEDTKLVESSSTYQELKIEVLTVPKVGQDIRPEGSDIELHSLVLKRFECISAAQVGILATVGKGKVPVYKRPTVGIISTGNEIQTPDETLKPGHIRDSNKSTLLTLLKQYSYAANDCGIVKDNPDSVKAALSDAFSKYDVIITTGGVSMGEYDIVKRVLVEDFAAIIHFGRVNVKPGKPTTFATLLYNEKPKVIFGLPGNPVSCYVTAVLFVIPALRFMERNNRPNNTQMKVSLAMPVKLDPRPEYARVQLKYEENHDLLRAYLMGNQISSRLGSFVEANALLCLPGKDTHGFADTCPDGTVLKAILLNVHSW